MLKHFAILLVFWTTTLTSKEIQLFSIPKAGTHLLTKAINCILDEVDAHNEYKLVVSHFGQPKGYVAAPKTLVRTKAICFFMIRDPKDVMVSLVNHLDDHAKSVKNNHPPHWYFTKEGKSWYNTWNNLNTFDEKLTNILETEFHDIAIARYPLIFSDCFRYMEICDGLVIRFEDLIGEKGGGQKSTQMTALQNIAIHLGINLSIDQVERISSNLWGSSDPNNMYFKVGKIGRGERLFSTKQKAIFREKYGSAARRLGYSD